MGRFSATARKSLIAEGRKTGYGDITSRQMGAMGGSTTANLTSMAKKMLEGDADSVKDLTEDDVFIRKGNEATILDLDVPTSTGSEGGSDETPESQETTPARANGKGSNRRTPART